MSQSAVKQPKAKDAPEPQANADSLVTEHLDLWTSAITSRNSTGRGSNKKIDLYGIKKLRELILELAVRGKLVPQDPTEEPASELLKRIAEKKRQLVTCGKIKNTKKLPEITEEEKPFKVPLNWSYVRVGDLTEKLGSGSTPRGGSNAYVDSGVPFLRSQNIWNEGLRLGEIAYIPERTHQAMENTRVIPGDVLLNITGASLGRSTIFPDSLTEANVSQHVTIIRLIDTQMARFIHLGILSPMIQKLVWGRQVGMAIEGLSKKVLENFEFPVPPIAEQHRIVAKVDELMALCDQLENQTERSLDAHATLAGTLLDALSQAQSAEELAENWQRLEQSWDLLFPSSIAGERAIDKLKQTTLQLAVMGKLVPQDPRDEPAIELLERISEEKKRLTRNGKLKDQKKAALYEATAETNDIPSGWCVADFGDITINRDSERVPLSVSERSRRQGKYEYYGASGVIDDIDDFLFDKPLLLIGEDGANLINRSTPIAFIAKGKYWVNNHAHVVDGITEGFLSYLSLYINSISLLPYITGMAQPKMNQAKMNSIPVLVPPEEEQRRIIAKVDELMSLCDRLKGQLQFVQETQQRFTDSIVAEALSVNSVS